MSAALVNATRQDMQIITHEFALIPHRQNYRIQIKHIPLTIFLYMILMCKRESSRNRQKEIEYSAQMHWPNCYFIIHNAFFHFWHVTTVGWRQSLSFLCHLLPGSWTTYTMNLSESQYWIWSVIFSESSCLWQIKSIRAIEMAHVPKCRDVDISKKIDDTFEDGRNIWAYRITYQGIPFWKRQKKNDHEIFIKVFLIKIPLSFFFAGIWILSIYNFRIAVIQENHLALMCQNAWAQRTKDLRMYQQSQMWAMQRFKMYEIPQIDENAGP